MRVEMPAVQVTVKAAKRRHLPPQLRCPPSPTALPAPFCKGTEVLPTNLRQR